MALQQQQQQQQDEQELWVTSIRSEMMSGEAEAAGMERRSQYEVRAARFFKVPTPQREANPGAYDPFVFAFGPHHAKFDCRPSVSDHFKLQAAKAILSKQRFDSLVSKVQEWDAALRDLYGVEHDNHIAQIRAPALAHLLVLDAVTILVATLRPTVFKGTPVANVFWKDVILLENQIPFALFTELLQEASEEDRDAFTQEDMGTFIEWHLYAASPFRDVRLCLQHPSIGSELNQSLLSCIYDGLTGAYYSPPSGNTSMIPTASHLRRCGIQFKGCEGLFTSICFDKAARTLVLPRILVAHDTRRLLLNLLAFESTARFPQCCAVTSYITFMDCLIDAEDDVQVLVDHGIIENHMSSHAEVAAMWNKLRVGLPTLFTVDDGFVIKQVNHASRLKWRKWTVAFTETYCERKPWLLFSIAAATLLLVLGFLQTLYTMRAG